MYIESKQTFTRIFKEEKFNLVIKKLTIDDVLTDNEKSYILSCALLFLDQYSKDKRYITYADFAYHIILKYSLRYKDYTPLYDFSINMGFYPIAKVIAENNLINDDKVNTFLINMGVENYYNGQYYETHQQRREKKEFLNNTSREKAFIAPTSFGKSSLIIDYINESERKKIAIIVPTKSLLSQTYKMVRDNNLNYKLLIHDEMYGGEKSFIAIFTQERALRLLAKNKVYFDALIIDEAHNVLKNDSRSILLSRLILKNKNLNPKTKIIYLSPLINDIKSIQVQKEQNINVSSIIFNVKEAEIYEYKRNKDIIKHNRFFINKSENNSFLGYKIGESKNYLNYIKNHSGNKNFIYNYRPIAIEKFARKLSLQENKIEKGTSIDEVISILEKEVHQSFYGIECMEHGIVYIHGQLPDLIKEYLEFKFKSISELKFIVANNVILEGINLPIDTLFILSTYNLKGKGLTNLIGRVNRLNDVFKSNENKLSMLLPKIHFVNNDDYNSSSYMFNKILLLRSRLFKDEIKNPILSEFDIEKVKDSDPERQTAKRKKISQIQQNENFLFTSPNNLKDRVKQYFIEYGLAADFYSLDVLVNEVVEFINSRKSESISWKDLNMLEKVKSIFIKNLDNIENFELRRLNNNAAINYYKHFIEVNRKKPLNENINILFKHFKERAKSDIEKERKFYFGKSYGEEPYISLDYENPRFNTYIDIGKVQTDKRLINLAIVKLKIEETFISFTINKFIVFLYDFEFISTEQYHLYIYGTTDKRKIALTKFGLNISLITRLEEDNQIDNLSLDKNNNLTANNKFKNYILKLNDFHKFEIERFLN